MSLASSLPSELISHVLDFISAETSIRDPLLSRMTKADVGACTLTCKYWAIRCRRRIFAQLTLSTAEDLAELVAIASAEATSYSAAQFVVRLTVEQSEGGVPWAHNVPRLLTNKLPNLQGFVYTNSPFADATALTLHPNTSRIFPAYLRNLADTVTSLELRNQAFGSFTDIARVVAALPLLLTSLSIISVIWKTTQRALPAALQFGRYLQNIHIERSTASWPFISILTTSTRNSTQFGTSVVDELPAFDSWDAKVIAAIAKHWLSGPSLADAIVNFSCRTSKDSAIREGFLMIELQFPSGPGPYVTFDFVQNARAREKSTVSVKEVTFYDLDKSETTDAALSFGWSDVDVSLSEFVFLHTVRFAFDDPAEWDIDELYPLARELVEKMPHTDRSGILEFRYGNRTLHSGDKSSAWMENDASTKNPDVGQQQGGAQAQEDIEFISNLVRGLKNITLWYLALHPRGRAITRDWS